MVERVDVGDVVVDAVDVAGVGEARGMVEAVEVDAEGVVGVVDGVEGVVRVEVDLFLRHLLVMLLVLLLAHLGRRRSLSSKCSKPGTTSMLRLKLSSMWYISNIWRE